MVFTWKGLFFIFLILIFNPSFSTLALSDNSLLPQASFTITPSSGAAPLTVAFDASLSNPGRGTSIIQYEWKFQGIADNWISTGSNPCSTYTYSNPGSFFVSLQVINNYNQKSPLSSQMITVLPFSCPDPSPSITVAPSSSGTAPFTVNFYSNQSDPGEGETISSYLWTFGDLSLPTYQANPTHTFLSPGTYQIQLTITNSCHKIGIVETSITVTEPTPTPTPIPTETPSPTPTEIPPPPTIETPSPTPSETPTPTTIPCPTPTAVFTSQQSQENPLMIEFNGTESDPGMGSTLLDYFWNFGDGNSQHSDQPTITHRYVHYGRFSVSLTVTNSCNQNHTSNVLSLNLTCPDPQLTGFSLDHGDLQPHFDPEIKLYKTSVGYETETITITPTANCPELAIEISDTPVSSGTPSAPIPLEVGSNSIHIFTRSPEGDKLQDYQLIVRRSAPIDTTLMFSDLSVDPNPFSPAWSPDKKDITKIGGKLNREIPLYIRFYSEGEFVDRILPKDINRYQGANIAHMAFDRSQWNGFGNGALPSQVYDIEVSTPVQLIRQTGKLSQEQKTIIHQPQALVVDNNGNLILASEGCPLQLLSPTGNFIRFLGKEKTTTALAYSPQEDIIGVNTKYLFKIDPSQRSEMTLCSFQDLEIKIDHQDKLEVNSGGEIFISCKDRGSVLVFSDQGNFLREIPVVENQSFQNEIYDITFGTDGSLYVSLMEFQKNMPVGMIKIFSPEGVLIHTITNMYGGGPIPLPALGEIGVFSDGSILLITSQFFHPLISSEEKSSSSFSLFCKLSPHGEVLDTWGQPGDFSYIRSLIIKDDICYVTDQQGFHRIVTMDKEGHILSEIVTPSDTYLNPVGMARLDQNRLVVLDNALERCAIINNDGIIEQVFPIWAYFNTSQQVKGVYAGPIGDIYLPGMKHVAIFSSTGIFKKIIPLELKKETPSGGWGGLFIDQKGNMIFSEGYPGKIWIFDPQGQAVKTISLVTDSTNHEKTANESHHWAEKPGFFGPLVSASEDGIYVQVMHQNQKGDFLPAFCELDLKTDQVRLIIPRNLEDEKKGVIPRMNYSIDDDLKAPFAVGTDFFYKVYSQSVVAYDRSGNFQWSLGQEPGWTFRIPGLLAQENELEIMESDWSYNEPLPIRIEKWSIGQEVILARGQVEIDNIPPKVFIFSSGMATLDQEQYTLKGYFEEKNFDHYEVGYRKAGSERGWNRVNLDLPPFNEKQIPQDDILARWFLSNDYRDTGVEVRVVAWDTAENSSESIAQVAFDDDGDGISNSEELALGTNPRLFSQIEIQTDLQTLVTPYFFADAQHELHFYVVDVTNPEKPRPLPHAFLHISFDAGTYSQSQNTVLWQSPDVVSQSITVHCVLPHSDQIVIANHGKSNLLEAEFNLLVMKDNDQDWMPDIREILAENDDSISTFLNNPDSDGDGVIDGKDLAPRTTYQECWHKTYHPSMLGKALPLCFYGIGGPGSHTVRYYYVEDENRQKRTVWHELGREGIIESEVTSAQRNKELSNSMLFPGQTSEMDFFNLTSLSQQTQLSFQNQNQLDTPSLDSIKSQLHDDWNNLIDIEIPQPPFDDQTQSYPSPPTSGKTEPSPPPFAITSFEGGTLQPNHRDEYLGMYEFAIKKNQEYVDFYYNSNTVIGVGLVNNVKSIDVCSFTETGIHRGYLVAEVPGSDDFLDRTLTFQWRIKEDADRTELPASPGDGFIQLAWLVEIYHSNQVIHFPGSEIQITHPESSSSPGPKLGPILPWDAVLYTDQVLAQSQGDHLYYASVKLPGERLTPGNSLFIKLTPFWVKKSHSKISFEPLPLPEKSIQSISLHDNQQVMAIIQDPPFFPITVSGVIVETLSPIQEWIPRLLPRPNHPLNDQIVEQLITSLSTSSNSWPAPYGCYDYFRTIDGVNYTVRCINSIGMRNQWKRGGLEPQLKNLIQEMSLDEVDVVCLVAPNRHELTLLFQNLPWDLPGQWWVEGKSIAEEGASFLLSENEFGGEVSQSDTSADSLLEDLKKVKNLVSAGIKIYSSWQKIASARSIEDKIDTSWLEFGDEAISNTESLQTLMTQKTSSGIILVKENTTQIQTLQQETLKRITEKTEIIQETELNQSSLLSQMQHSLQFKAFLSGAKVGTILIGSGSQIYACSSQDDWVGIVVYALKGGLELSSEVFKLAGIGAQTRLGSYLPSYLVMPEKSFWVKGIPIKSISGSLNVVGIITGTIETGYNLYLYTHADSVLTKKEAARNTCATAIDAGISVVEPLGGFIMGSWIIGSEIVHFTLKLFDVEASPYIKKVTSSPGQFLTYTVVKIDPQSVPFDKAIDACTTAQNDAIKNCKKYNKDSEREYIYIFTPPS
jgi:PKD repeat protein